MILRLRARAPHWALCVLVLGGFGLVYWRPTPVRAQQAPGRVALDRPWQLGARVRGVAGYDSNPTLSPDPSIRSMSPADEEEPAGPVDPPDMDGEMDPASGSGFQPLPRSGVFRTDARVSARAGRTWWGGAQLEFDGRGYTAGGTRQESRLRLQGGWSGSDRLALLVGVDGGRYAASFGQDDAWFGEAMLRAIWALSEHWVLGGQGVVGLRAYDAGNPEPQRDRSYGGGLDLTFRKGVFMASLGVLAERRESNQALVVRSELFPWLSVGLRMSPVDLRVQYASFIRVFEAAQRDGVEHIVRGQAVYEITSSFGLLAAAEYGTASAESRGLVYDRVEVVGGLQVTWEHAPAPRDLRREALQEQGPVTLVEGGARFRFRFPGAERVSVIGTFNGWRAEQGRLYERSDGVFEGTLSIPAGRHRYHLLVDGKPVRPPDATAYVSDGFGGEDAVLTVPKAR